MSHKTGSTIREEHLDAVIAQYLRARCSGEEPQIEQWIQDHPDLEEELREFCEDHQRLERMAKPLSKPFTEPDDYELLEEIARGGMGIV